MELLNQYVDQKVKHPYIFQDIMESFSNEVTYDTQETQTKSLIYKLRIILTSGVFDVDVHWIPEIPYHASYKQ